MLTKPDLRSAIVGLSAAMLVAVAPRPARAQVTLEAHGGAGYASVKMSDWAGGGLNDWQQTSYVGYAQVFFAKAGSVALGAEVGNQYFFWYEVAVPYGISTIYYEYGVQATRVMAVARFQGKGNVFAEVGLGAHLFDGFTDGGLAGAVGYKIPVGGKISIPIKLRADFVNDSDTKLTTISATAGLSYSLK